MNFWMWVILMWMVQVFTMVRYPSRLYKGRIFTRPLVKMFKVNSFGVWAIRMGQILGMSWIAVIISMAIGLHHSYPLGCILIMCLYFDDILTGDDSTWKRFKSWAKNNVKWKMELPPAPVQEIA